MDYQKLPDSQKKKLADDAHLLKVWRQWHREQLAEALTGPHGATFSQLMALLKDLGKTTHDNLVAFVRSIDWSPIDYELRLVALHEVNQAIVRFRERHGLPPLDDGFPGDRNTTFRRIRRILTVYPFENGGFTGADAGFENLSHESKVQHHD